MMSAAALDTMQEEEIEMENKHTGGWKLEKFEGSAEPGKSFQF